MAFKTPEEFEVGDAMVNEAGTPYSGSAMTVVEDLGDGRTLVDFANGEKVVFYHGVPHRMRE